MYYLLKEVVVKGRNGKIFEKYTEKIPIQLNYYELRLLDILRHLCEQGKCDLHQLNIYTRNKDLLCDHGFDVKSSWYRGIPFCGHNIIKALESLNNKGWITIDEYDNIAINVFWDQT